MRTTGGRAVVDSLDAWGVNVVFGIPGVHTLALYDALYDHPRIRHVTVRHEQGAGFMADGYARASGNVGVAITTTGPAAVNALTPLGEAYAESSPVLLIASGPTDDTAGQDLGTLHEMRNQFGTLESVSGQGKRVASVAEIPDAIADAFEKMQRNRPRPYVLEVPLDILMAEAEVDVRTPETYPPRLPDQEKLAEAVKLIQSSEKPLILAGGGAKDAGEQVKELAEQLQAPVGLTFNGLGTVPADYSLFLGSGTSMGKWVKESDLLIAVGTRFSESNTRDWKVSPARLLHVDLDPSVLGRQYPADVGLECDAQAGLQALRTMLDGIAAKTKWSLERVTEARAGTGGSQSSPGGVFAAMIQTLRESLDRDAVVANDMTMISYQARRTFPVYTPRTFLAPACYGTLGFSLPAAIGAKLAQPGRQVVALCGDGGFLFTAQELATAKQQRLGLPIVLCNDNKYAAIGRAQDKECNGRQIGVNLENPDFVMFAKSFGINGVRVTSCDALKGALENAFKADLPTLIEAYLPEFQS